jgi:putative membrane protein insertion efficiency factor
MAVLSAAPAERAVVGSLDVPDPHDHNHGDTNDTTHSPTGAVRALLGIIRLYQLFSAARLSPCRFTPTCSTYAAEALTRHGVRRGLALTLRRLGRCRPGGPFGADPVPE